MRNGSMVCPAFCHKQASGRRRNDLRSPPRAAIAGLTRWVRPPAPWRPSKLRLLVDAQRSPGSSRSAFIARHIEQPGSRHSKPAALKTEVEAFALGLLLHQARAGHDHRQLDVGGDARAEPAHDRRRLAQVFDARVGARADEDLVDADVGDQRVRLRAPCTAARVRSRRACRSPSALGIGHAVVDRRPPFRAKCPRSPAA